VAAPSLRPNMWITNALTRAQRGATQLPGIWSHATKAGVPAGQRWDAIKRYVQSHPEGARDLATLGAMAVPMGVGAYDIGSTAYDRLT
jgi:hypothetical protein